MTTRMQLVPHVGEARPKTGAHNKTSVVKADGTREQRQSESSCGPKGAGAQTPPGPCRSRGQTELVHLEDRDHLSRLGNLRAFRKAQSRYSALRA